MTADKITEICMGLCGVIMLIFGMLDAFNLRGRAERIRAARPVSILVPLRSSRDLTWWDRNCGRVIALLIALVIGIAGALLAVWSLEATAEAAAPIREIQYGGDVGYFGVNVPATPDSLLHPPQVAIRINSRGTVTVYLGATVPDLDDDEGRPVVIRQVHTIKP